MISVKGARLGTVLGALAAAVLASAAVVAPARADEVQDAAEVLKTMSPEQIRTELQRRRRLRRAAHPVPAGALDQPRGGGGAGPRTRSFAVPQPIEQFDDATMADAVKFHTRGIYGGKDDRKDWYQVDDENVRRIAGATVAIFNSNDTTPASTDIQLRTKSLAESKNICKNQLFSAQVTGAGCSGTLVRDDVVLTAAHCVGEKSSSAPKVINLRFVFGYRVEKAGDLGPTTVPAGNVFHGKTLLGSELDPDTGHDWALVKLDRPVPASVAEPVSTWRKNALAKGDKVFVVGYPSGLPLKYAGNASVVDASNPAYYVTDLDSFHGNSGSGVFAEGTNELVGVLVRGGEDYVTSKKGCKVVFPCTLQECKGEEVTRINLIQLR